MKSKPKAQRRLRRAVKRPNVRRVMDEEDVIELVCGGEEGKES